MPPVKETNEKSEKKTTESRSEQERREKLQEETRRESSPPTKRNVDAAEAGGLGLPPVELVDDAAKFKELVAKAKPKIDTNNDGVFSDTEITAAMNNKELKGTDAQVASILKRLKDTLSAMKCDGGLTMADIDKSQEMIDLTKSGNGTDESKKITDSITGTLQTTKASLDAAETANHQLFSTHNPLDAITPEAAKQGDVGDCYFISALSGMAATKDGKEQIKNMIKDNGDGTYTVTFPGAKDEPITVAAPTDTELATYAKADSNGIWAAVLEKAYGQYCAQSVLRRDILNPFRSDIPQENTNGAHTDSALRLLTGKTTESVDMTDQAKTEKTLEDALNCGEAVTLGRKGSLSEMIGWSDEDKQIPHGHQYSIIGYDPATKMVTVRNPWGHGEPTDADGKPKDGKDDGIYQMPVSDLAKYYDSMSVTHSAA
jgi:hypothetical protein